VEVVGRRPLGGGLLVLVEVQRDEDVAVDAVGETGAVGRFR
jgi:hypothetical protein